MQRKRYSIKFLAILFMLALILSLAACGGDSASFIQLEGTPVEEEKRAGNIEVEDSEAIYILPLSVRTMRGTWKSEPFADGSWIEAVVDYDGDAGILTLFQDTEWTRETYWTGLSTSLTEDDTSYCLTSNRNGLKKMISTEEELILYYSKYEDAIYYTVTDDDGTTSTVWLYKESDEVPDILDYLIDADPEDEEEDEEDEEDDDESEDTGEEVVTVEGDTEVTYLINDETCDHNWGTGRVTREPTCETAGVRTYTCSKCGSTKTESITALGHDYELNTIRAATETSEGTGIYVCSRCSDAYVATLPKLDHDYQPVYKTVHHEETGHYEDQPIMENRYVCDVCGWFTEDLTGISTGDERSLVRSHIQQAHGGNGGYTRKSVQVGEETVYVVDSEEYDEKVVDYYQCANCGDKKDDL